MSQGSGPARVLVVDDEPDIRELLAITLGRMGLDTLCAETLAEAYECLQRETLHLCLTDMRLPDGNGIDLVEWIQEKHPQLPVAMITAHGNIDSAIRALKAGAFDFISKPVALEKLRSLVTSALELDRDAPAPPRDDGLIGDTPAMQTLRRQIDKVARSQAPVHIYGESGVGKEVVARQIHGRGPRAAGPFVPVNCGAIPGELLESELFGHMKGSFTGASRDKLGLFQAAEGGTLFLDEVADLPLPMQVKLLRAVQEKRVRPVGSEQELPTDVRLLSATHKSLEREVAEGRFREDLFFRINVIELRVPGLRERLDDIPALARVILARIAGSSGEPRCELAADALAALRSYSFPGNVRELENVLERAAALSEGTRIGSADLQLPAGAAPRPQRRGEASPGQPHDLLSAVGGDLDGYLADIERSVLNEALAANRWNRTDAARTLGVSFRSLRYRLKKLGIND